MSAVGRARRNAMPRCCATSATSRIVSAATVLSICASTTIANCLVEVCAHRLRSGSSLQKLSCELFIIKKALWDVFEAEHVIAAIGEIVVDDQAREVLSQLLGIALRLHYKTIDSASGVGGKVLQNKSMLLLEYFTALSFEVWNAAHFILSANRTIGRIVAVDGDHLSDTSKEFSCYKNAFFASTDLHVRVLLASVS